MIFLILGVLALVIGGCACVVWAQRGGPRWARVVASVMLGAGDLARRSGKGRSSNKSSGDDGA